MKKFTSFISEAKGGPDDEFVQTSLADMDIDSQIDGSTIKVRGGSSSKNKAMAFLRKNGLATDYKVEVLKEAVDPKDKKDDETDEKDMKDKKGLKKKKTIVIINPSKSDV